VGALDDPGPLHFGKDADKGEHRSPDGAGEIEGFPERDESNSKVLELVQQGHEVPQVPPEAIEDGDSHEIELTTAGVGHHGIESGAALAGAADGMVGVGGHDRPTRALGMFAECAELVLGSLIGGTDASIEGNADAECTRFGVIHHRLLRVMDWSPEPATGTRAVVSQT
jgi:hypothetical protein